MSPEKLLCKDCCNSRASWMTRIFNRSYGWSCRLGYQGPRFDPVNGGSTAGFYHACGTVRLDKNVCGPTAIAWQPRTKKDLFSLLQVKR